MLRAVKLLALQGITARQKPLHFDLALSLEPYASEMQMALFARASC